MDSLYTPSTERQCRVKPSFTSAGGLFERIKSRIGRWLWRPRFPDITPVQATATRLTLSALNILVVDDDYIWCKMLETHLGALDQHVDSVHSGAEALSALRQRRFDMVFLDLHMPGMDGVETLRRIRQLSRDCRRIPIIGLTADSQRQTMVKCLTGGMDEFLAKPVSQTDLLHIVKRWQSARAA